MLDRTERDYYLSLVRDYKLSPVVESFVRRYELLGGKK